MPARAAAMTTAAPRPGCAGGVALRLSWRLQARRRRSPSLTAAWRRTLTADEAPRQRMP